MNFSPAKLAEMYRAAVERRDAGATDRHTHDIIMVAEMVISLAEESDERPFYTCKHLDDATGLCTVYDDRPQMCSDYPSYGIPGRSCEQCGYTQTPAEPELVQLKAAS